VRSAVLQRVERNRKGQHEAPVDALEARAELDRYRSLNVPRMRLYVPTSSPSRRRTKLNGSQASGESHSEPRSAKRRTSATNQLDSCDSKSSVPAASRMRQWLRTSERPKSFSSSPIT
jgi:hypothetical protein